MINVAGAEQSSSKKGAETKCRNEDSPEKPDEHPTGENPQTSPVHEVEEMISEVEDKVYKTARDRLERLTELRAMEVRDVKASNKSNAGLLRRYKREHKEDQQKQIQEQCKVMQKDLKGEEETTTMES